jgi:hypothetical protein
MGTGEMSLEQPLTSGPPEENLDEHYETVVLNLLMGRVTPVLGAGASLYGRIPPPEGEPGLKGALTPPTGPTDAPPEGWAGAPSAAELAAYLVNFFKVRDSSSDLLRVAQWVYALRGGSGGLYTALHEMFDKDFPSTGLHDFLGKIPGALRTAGRGKPPLFVTTNYDDLIEKTLDALGETYDVVVYMAEGPHEGLFCHVAPDGTLRPIDPPESYLAVDPDRQTVVLKMHGFVCRRNSRDDSYVITEDHYIDYLTRTDLTKLLPPPVMTRLLDCQLLFLGYSLRDWNFRAILAQIHRNRLHDNEWWAVRLNPDRLEAKSWEKRNVQIINVALEQYIPKLEAVFDADLTPV